jgi:uncharacterized protein (DUF1501 family)
MCKQALFLYVTMASVGSGHGMAVVRGAALTVPGDGGEDVKVRGHVLDPAGKALAGAEVFLGYSKDLGLHPVMDDAAKLLENGRLAIVQGVSYPNPSRSHFDSMAVWHSADVNRSTIITDTSLGWIGQALDGDQQPVGGSPAAQFVGPSPSCR